MLNYKNFLILSSVTSSCLLILTGYTSGDSDMHQGKNPHYSNNKNGGVPNRMDDSMVQDHSDEGSIYDMSKMMPEKVLRGDSIDHFKGRIQSVSKVVYPDKNRIEIVLSTDEGNKTVFIGPEIHLNMQQVKLIAGDAVEVDAYRIVVNGSTVYVASEIRRNGNVLRLRDRHRRAVWEEGHRPELTHQNIPSRHSRRNSGE